MTKTEFLFTFKEHKLTFDEFLNLTKKTRCGICWNLFFLNCLLMAENVQYQRTMMLHFYSNKPLNKSFDSLNLCHFILQMGITQVGVWTKILDAIREVHKKEWDVASLQSMERHSLRWYWLCPVEINYLSSQS